VSDRVRRLDHNEGETVALALAAGGMLALVLGWILGSGTLRALGLTAAVVGGGFNSSACCFKSGVAGLGLRSIVP
jgi:hypothetical protein